MKKQILLGLAVLGTASMLCGFDSAQTADSVLEQMQDAVAAQTNVSSDGTFNANAEIALSDGTTDTSIGLSASGTTSVAAITDPLQAKLTVSADVGMMGVNQNFSYEVYAVPGENSDTLETYIGSSNSASGESDWSHSSSSVDYSGLSDLISSADASVLTDQGVTFDLGADPAQMNGSECYVLTTTIDSKHFGSVIDNALAEAGESSAEAQIGADFLKGLVINISYYVDTATYLPAGLHIDLNDSDFSVIGDLLEEQLAGALGGNGETSSSFGVNDISADLTFSYGTVSEITVPQEALDTTENPA